MKSSDSISEVRSIIVAWNSGRVISNCVNSLLNEGFLASHIWIVDQGSSDGGVEATKREFPGVHVVKSPGNRSFGTAVNTAARRAGGKSLLIVNPDTQCLQRSVGRMLETMSSDPAIAAVGPQIINSDGTNVTRFSRTKIVRALGIILAPSLLAGQWKLIEQRAFGHAVPCSVNFIEGSALLVRRVAFDLVGGFDEDFAFFSEDADLCVRLRKLGYRLVHEPRARVVHEGNHAFAQVPDRRYREFISGLLLFYWKHAYRRYIWLRRSLSFILLMKRLLHDREHRQQNDALRLIIHSESYLIRDPVLDKASKPQISVIVPTYNRPDCIERFLKLLNRQTFRDFETIIVDQAKSDNISSIIKKHARKNVTRRVALLNANRSLAKNVGIQEAKGGVILFCDDDIIPDSRFLESHFQIHEDPLCGGASLRTVTRGQVPSDHRDVLRITWYGKIVANFTAKITCEVAMVGCGNMSFKRAALDQSGTFDCSLNGTSVLEEGEFCERIRRRGWKLIYSDVSTVVHEPQYNGNAAEEKSNPVGYYRSLHHNLVLLFLKHRSRLTLPAVIVWSCLRAIKQGIMHRIPPAGIVRMCGGILSGFQSYARLLN